MTRTQLFWFQLCLLLWLPGLASAVYVRQWEARRFLGASSVYNVSTDSRGFLWFSTNAGLIRFDGHQTKVFNHNNGLPSDIVFKIFEDRCGRIWPFCFNGEFCFLKGDTLHTRQTDRWLAGFPEVNTYVTIMANAPDDCGVFFGLRTRSILRTDRKAAHWVETHIEGYNRLLATDSSIVYSPTLGVDYYSSDRTHRIALDSTHITIYQNGKQIWRMEDSAYTYLTVNDASLTREGKLLLATMHGLECWDPATKEQMQLLSGMRITSCTQALDGSIWATAEDRIYTINQELDGIMPLADLQIGRWSRSSTGDLMGIKDSTLYCVHLRNGVPTVSPRIRNIPAHYDPVYSNDSFAVFYNVWMRTSNIMFHGVQHQVATPIIYKLEHDRFFIKSLYNRGGGRYFGFGDRAIYSFRRIPTGLIVTDTTAYNRKVVSASRDDQTGDIYFVSGNSLYRSVGREGQISTVLTFPRSVSISTISVNGDYVYGAAAGNTFYRFAIRGPDRGVRGFDFGFPVMSFARLGKGRIILRSNDYSYVFDDRSPQPVPERIQYPISSSHFEELSMMGRYCVVQLDGSLYYFDTALINRNPQRTNIYLSDVQINGKRHFGPAVDIRAGTLNLTLSAEQLNFHDARPGMRYRIKKGDTGVWRSVAGTELALTLAGSGTYELQVSANEEPQHDYKTALLIHLKDPFTDTVWFYLLLLAAVIVLVILCTWLIVGFRRRQFGLELAYVRLEHRAINALLNPHFIFNSINNIQGLINKASRRQAADYLAILSRLIRQNLENLQRDVIPLESELRLIRHYVQLQNLRHNQNIRFQVENADEADDLYVPPLLIHTFVENAIVHGYAGHERPLEIVVRFTVLDNDRVEIRILDNGLGLESTANTKVDDGRPSYGIAFNQKRLGRLSDFCRVEQSIVVRTRNDAEGTEAIIILSAQLDVLLPNESVHDPVV